MVKEKKKTVPAETGSLRDSKGRFVPGVSGNPTGPKPGFKKEAIEIKLAFIKAFHKLGGVNGLVKWAKGKGSKKEFYRILATMLPKDIEIDYSDELIDKYKEWSADELRAKELELARAIIGDRGNDKAAKEGKPS